MPLAVVLGVVFFSSVVFSLCGISISPSPDNTVNSQQQAFAKISSKAVSVTIKNKSLLFLKNIISNAPGFSLVEGESGLNSDITIVAAGDSKNLQETMLADTIPIIVVEDENPGELGVGQVERVVPSIARNFLFQSAFWNGLIGDTVSLIAPEVGYVPFVDIVINDRALPYFYYSASKNNKFAYYGNIGSLPIKWRKNSGFSVVFNIFMKNLVALNQLQSSHDFAPKITHEVAKPLFLKSVFLVLAALSLCLLLVMELKAFKELR